MFTLDENCGTWIQDSLCSSDDGAVTVIKTWDIKITTLLSTKYILSDGTVSDTPPLGLNCSSTTVGKVYVKQFNVGDVDLGQSVFTDPLFLQIKKDPITALGNVDVILDGRTLYEGAIVNWFALNGDEIEIYEPLTEGVVLTIKFFY